MSTCISTQMCFYVRTLFEHPSKWYESYQENGTKYLKSRKKLDENLQQQLNACAGEIFLCGIPADTQAEKIAEVASLLAEVYILRFKVHFSGASRGFAYLQYIDPNLMSLALEKLPLLFRALHLPMIKVCESRNSSKLILRRTFNMKPLEVYENLTNIIKFDKLVGRELSPGNFEYQIIFKCNEEAVHARRDILKSILKFGSSACIIWDSSTHFNNKVNNYMQREKFNKNFHIPRQLNQHEMKKIADVPNNCRNEVEHNNSSASKFLNAFNNMKLS